jgi:hypothetical protein
MEDPALTWTIVGLVWAIGLYRAGYQRGRRAGLAARRPADPSPGIMIAVPDRHPAASVEALPAQPAKRAVRIGGRTIVVDASSLTER